MSSTILNILFRVSQPENVRTAVSQMHETPPRKMPRPVIRIMISYCTLVSLMVCLVLSFLFVVFS